MVAIRPGELQVNQEGYRRLISGKRSGLAATVIRFCLAVLARIYAAVILVRNFLYSSRWLKVHRSPAKVISVGNITTGGTGKTPLVIWLYRQLRRRNISCAILTRGYKVEKGKFSDEPVILAKNCPDARVIINPDRIAGATKAVEEFKSEALIMDDGFQHRRLARDIDIVTIDATCPFGYGRMLPAGLLREPMRSLKRADAAVITRCDQVSDEQLDQIEKRLLKANSKLAIARSLHAPIKAKSLNGTEISLEELTTKNIFTFCGIGNPRAFFETVRKTGSFITGSIVYNDHHHYSQADIDDIYEQAKYLKADVVLSTQKDWNKIALSAGAKKDMLFAYLAVELEFISGAEGIIKLIEDMPASKISSE